MAYSDIKEMLKDARDLATGANDHQTVSLLKDIQLEVYDLLDENRNLRLEIEKLKNKDIRRNELEWKNNVYIKRNTTDEFYCPKCLDDEEKLIRMQLTIPYFSSNYSVKCPKCSTEGQTDIGHGVDTTPSFY